MDWGNVERTSSLSVRMIHTCLQLNSQLSRRKNAFWSWSFSHKVLQLKASPGVRGRCVTWNSHSFAEADRMLVSLPPCISDRTCCFEIKEIWTFCWWVTWPAGWRQTPRCTSAKWNPENEVVQTPLHEQIPWQFSLPLTPVWLNVCHNVCQEATLCESSERRTILLTEWYVWHSPEQFGEF